MLQHGFWNQGPNANAFLSGHLKVLSTPQLSNGKAAKEGFCLFSPTAICYSPSSFPFITPKCADTL